MLAGQRLRALLASAAGAATFLVLGMPLPLLLGPMAGCLVVLLAGLCLQDLGQFGIFVLTFLGVAIGTTFTPEIVANIPDMARSLVFIPPFILVIGLTGFCFSGESGSIGKRLSTLRCREASRTC